MTSFARPLENEWVLSLKLGGPFVEIGWLLSVKSVILDSHVVPDIGSGLMTAIVCSSASTLPRWRLAAQFYGAVFHVTPTASRLTPNLYVRFPAEKLKTPLRAPPPGR
jgi:hypothetical protein